MTWWQRPRTVSVCVDTPGWFDRHAEELVQRARAAGDDAAFVRQAADVGEGGIAFYLSCLKITPPEILARNHHNIVVHASDLPKGRGFSPLVWQVLEGRDRIPLSMIFASETVDAGDLIMRDEIVLTGRELNDDLRDLMGARIVQMCTAYLSEPEAPSGVPQKGEATWYRRRRPADSQLDPEQSIAAQFDLLRVVDNQRYPAFFDYRGERYVLKIEKAAEAPRGASLDGKRND